MATSTAVVNPNYGLVLNKAPIALDARMLQDGYNFRVKNGNLTNLNLGWTRFEAGIQLNGAVLLIADFIKRDGTEILVLGTKMDLYQYRLANHDVRFITPIYATGTASASGTAVTGAGTAWNSGSPKNAKAGDQISFGNNNQTDPAATWFTVQSVNSDTSITLTASAGTVGSGNYTIRKLFTGDETAIWVDAEFINAGPSLEDQLWLTNGVDAPVLWNGTTAQVVPQNALGFTCKYITVFENMMLFGNLVQAGTSKPTDMVNSNPGEPANVTTGLASQFKVHGGYDNIRAMRPLGATLAIYSELTVTAAQFVGDPLVFVFRNAISGVGVVAAKAVANFGNYHEFLHRDSQYFFDGATVRNVHMHIWREMIRTQDPTRVGRAYSHFNDENGELIWSLPATTDAGAGTKTSPPVRAINECYLEEVQAPPSSPHFGNPHTLRAFPFTAAGYYSRKTGTTWDTLTQQWSQYNFRWNDQFFFSAFPLSIVGDNNGKLYSVNTSQDGDGVALPSFIKFGRRSLGGGRVRGLIKRIYPFVTQFSNALKVTTHLADHASGPATINQTDSFDQTLPQGGHFVTPYRRGRFVDIEFGTDGPSQPWELTGYDIDIVKGGLR